MKAYRLKKRLFCTALKRYLAAGTYVFRYETVAKLVVNGSADSSNIWNIVKSGYEYDDPNQVAWFGAIENNTDFSEFLGDYTESVDGTGIQSVGSQGAQGTQGTQGFIGIQGDPGGPQGWQGPLGTPNPVAIVQARRSTTQTIQAAELPIGFDVEDAETDPAAVYHDDVNTERIVCNVSGSYLIQYFVAIDATAFGTFQVHISKNGSETALPGSIGSVYLNTGDRGPVFGSIFLEASAGDWFELHTYRDASAAGFIEADATFGIELLQGPSGAQGPVGVQGIQGAQGLQGTNPGPQGDYGPQGNTGVQGNQGNQGIVGPQGVEGNQGPQAPLEPVAVVQARRTTDYTVTDSFADIPFDATDVETDPAKVSHDNSTNNERLGIHSNGTYLVQANFQVECTSTGVFTFRFYKNGNTEIPGTNMETNLTTGVSDISAMAIFTDLVDGDYLTFQAMHSGGSAVGYVEAGVNIGAQLLQGPSGAQGALGPQGVQGNQGYQGTNPGPQGNIGPQGNQGVRGLQGNQGDIGFQGDTGPQGNQGDIGPQGWQGVQGAQGLRGVQGFQGNDGMQGNQGNEGPQGVMGLQGNQGDIGFQGNQGLRGLQGNIGDTGAQGNQGDIGPQGLQGVQGAQGNVGDTGAQGWQGDIGPQGVVGPQGIVGDTGAQGNQGPLPEPSPVAVVQARRTTTYSITDSYADVTLDATDVKTDAAIIDHDNSTNSQRISIKQTGTYLIQAGLVITCTTDGTFYIRIYKNNNAVVPGTEAETDLTAGVSDISFASCFVSLSNGDYITVQAQHSGGAAAGILEANTTFGAELLQGPNGAQGGIGPQGTQGNQGFQGTNPGPQGAQGNAGGTGLQGAQGAQGLIGLQGAQGNQGFQGFQGAIGEQGAQGNQGNQGNVGDTGVQGPQGNQGILGSQGNQGPAGTNGNNSATATGTITNTQTTDQLATTMTLTPASGTYQVWFTGTVSNGTTNNYTYMSVWSGGSQVAASEVNFQSSAANRTCPFCCIATVTVNGAQAIEGRWRVSAGTSSMYQRTLMILKVA